jgi:hypothetical protein
MFTRQLTALLLPLILLLSIPTQGFVGGIAVSMGRATNVDGAAIPPFSADAQIETDEHQINSHVNFQPGMVRDEADMGGMKMITIQRYDAGKVWVLMGEGMYMETAVGQSDQAPDYKLIERTMEGTEVINGEETAKYKTVYEGPDGRFGGFTWFTKDNIAVKGFMISETDGEKQRLKWTMTNVQRGEQPDELFELPPGAQPMGNMGGLMDMMRNMSTTPEGGDPTEQSKVEQPSTSDAILEGVKGLGKIFGN